MADSPRTDVGAGTGADTFAVAFFDNVRDITPKQKRLSADEVAELLTEHKVYEVPKADDPDKLKKIVDRMKQGMPAICPAEFLPDATRNAQGVASLSMFFLDLDAGQLLEVVRPLWTGLKYVVYSTFQNKPGHPKLRVAFFFVRPVLASEWRRVWTNLSFALGGGYGDDACKDPCRLYFLPACQEEWQEAKFAYRVDGELLDPDRYPDLDPETETGKKGPPPDKIAAGHRHGWMVWYAKTLGDQGFDRTGILAALVKWDQERNDPPKPHDPRDPNDELVGIAKFYGVVKPAAAANGSSTKATVTVEPPVAGGGEREQDFPLSEAGNAERLIAVHGADLLYVPQWGMLRWRNGVWARDLNNSTLILAKQVVRAIPDSVRNTDNSTYQKAVTFALGCERARILQAILTLTQADPAIAAEVDDFDAKPLLLNVRNGTIDLETGKVRQPDRTDPLTKQAPTRFDASATCPLFEAMLHRIFDGDKDQIAFVVRWFGLCLTGSPDEQKVQIGYGGGANGKSTLLGAVGHALGCYAHSTYPELLMRLCPGSGGNVVRASLEHRSSF